MFCFPCTLFYGENAWSTVGSVGFISTVLRIYGTKTPLLQVDLIKHNLILANRCYFQPNQLQSYIQDIRGQIWKVEYVPYGRRKLLKIKNKSYNRISYYLIKIRLRNFECCCLKTVGGHRFLVKRCILSVLISSFH